MDRTDYDYYDLLLCMDHSNLRNMQRICGGDPEKKMFLLMEYTNLGREVADPWYTGNFTDTWQDIFQASEKLLKMHMPQTGRNANI